jgi:hypothetical protein
MPEYIHLVSATKTPENRGTNPTPFEHFPSNPNDEPGSSFGEAERTMFLPVYDDPAPLYDEVTEYLLPYQTPDVTGILRPGRYDAPTASWHRGYAIAGNTLEDAREIKLYRLSEAVAAALDLGYPVSTYIFPFTEDMFTLLDNRQRWLEAAINDGTVPANTKITFSDKNGAEVSVGLAALRAHYIAYGSKYLRIFEKEVDARDAIRDALTPAAVSAVAWNF